MSITPIVDTDTLAAFCAHQKGAQFITVDTEFVREKTYYPILCLVQIAGPEEEAVIDAMAPGIDLSPLATLFAVKDRFTVLDLGMAPWGYGEDDLAKALKSGAVNDLDYWRRLDYEPPKRKAPKAPKKKKVGASGRNKKKAAKSRAFG